MSECVCVCACVCVDVTYDVTIDTGEERNRVLSRFLENIEISSEFRVRAEFSARGKPQKDVLNAKGVNKRPAVRPGFSPSTTSFDPCASSAWIDA